MTYYPIKVCGIPALAQVCSFINVRGSFSRNAPSDLDYYGYQEIDWEICDRRGRAAPWLDRKLKTGEREQIESDLIRRILEDETDLLLP